MMRNNDFTEDTLNTTTY
uniref:Uncharacterized protein n=1 Tax=Rhizophora mucronata TaxID=61149 RepID=A0A2P2QKD3_RHIMU